MARSFNGTSDLIQLATPSGLAIAGTSFSIAVWALSTSSAAGDRTVFITNSGGTVGGAANSQVYLRSGDSTLNTFEFGYWDQTTNHRAVAASAYSTNIWYSVVGTWNTTTYRIYINGTLSASSSDAVGPNYAPGTVGAQIGVDGNIVGGGRFWAGAIAELGFWPTIALTATEAIAIARGVRLYKIRPKALVGYWALDGVSSPEPDLSGNRHNGTLTGTAFAFGPPMLPFTPRWPMGSILPAPPPPLTLMPQILW